jgi:hypothetical protein
VDACQISFVIPGREQSERARNDEELFEIHIRSGGAYCAPRSLQAVVQVTVTPRSHCLQAATH